MNDKFPADWKRAKLREISEIILGGTPSTKIENYWNPREVDWVTAKDVSNASGSKIHVTERKISVKGLENSNAKLLPPLTTVIIARGATTGKVRLLGRKMAINQTCYGIIAKNQVDPLFLFYFLRHIYRTIRNVSHGSVFETVTTSTLASLDIPLPSIVEQRTIAHILGTLDDKIELNQRMNATLEAIARAIFKSWFVDFDPVYAKLEGRDPGLPAHIADLFPDRLVDSEFGEIPEGWEIKSLGELLVYKNERTGSEDIDAYSCTNDGLKLRSSIFKKQLTSSKSNYKLITTGDLVFGLSRQILNFGLMRDAIGCVSPAYKVFETDAKIIIPDLLEKMIRQNMEYYYTAVSASSREGQSLSTNALKTLMVVRPPRSVQKAYTLAIKTMASRNEYAKEESGTLQRIRDTLLPKLISGELRIEDPQAFLERVT